MEHFFSGMLHAALWAFFIILILAVVGIIAIIQWIVNAVRKTEAAVETGVADVQGHLHHHNDQ